jgi:[ribosomal protein S5]-alanine N-acetyltransferase
MQIPTQRLLIKPLSKQELSNYVLADFSLEDSLQLIPYPRTVNDRVKNAIGLNILPKLTGQIPHDWFVTIWTVIQKDQRVMVAEVYLKGPLQANGEIEIGYSTYPDFEGNGYMTEAVGLIIEWAFQQVNVTAILAETNPDNTASRRVLEKNGFMVCNQNSDTISWRLDKLVE